MVMLPYDDRRFGRRGEVSADGDHLPVLDQHR